jgi:hypothetical protein
MYEATSQGLLRCAKPRVIGPAAMERCTKPRVVSPAAMERTERLLNRDGGSVYKRNVSKKS